MLDVKKMKADLLTTNPTLYCSIMAHIRGKLHMTKVHGATIWELLDEDCWSYFGYLKKECIADGRRHMFNWTMEDQEKYIEEVLNKYIIENAIMK